jgi:hypothetical protein
VENKGLLFIPDISGFTRFINEMEIDHSQHIIKELLEVIINSNSLGLDISEIEGDAVLFYKFGESPGLEKIYGQVEEMFRSFHSRLATYDLRRFCQCKACSSAIDLTLKIITHYGEFTGYNIKNYNKLIGKDVIVAHLLLKNDIPVHEDWLVTKTLMNDDVTGNFKEWMKWDSSSKHTENGIIPFRYTQLGYLKKEISPEPLPRHELAEKKKLFSLSKIYNTDIITLFHGTGDFSYRSKWQEGVKSVAEVEHFLPRVGMKCQVELDTGKSVLFSTSYSFAEDKIEFSETSEDGKTEVYYTLEKISDNSTKLTIDYYIKKSFWDENIYSLFKKKKITDSYNKSLVNLETFIKQVK